MCTVIQEKVWQNKKTQTPLNVDHRRHKCQRTDVNFGKAALTNNLKMSSMIWIIERWASWLEPYLRSKDQIFKLKIFRRLKHTFRHSLPRNFSKNRIFKNMLKHIKCLIEPQQRYKVRRWTANKAFSECRAPLKESTRWRRFV